MLTFGQTVTIARDERVVSKVFFIDSRAEEIGESLPFKAKKLFYEAGLNRCVEKGDKVAIKIHMGEWENTSYLRPNLFRIIVDTVKDLGGEPIIGDTTTLSYGPWPTRVTAYYYNQTHTRHGFTSETMGCPVIVADGIYGEDDVCIRVPNGVHLKRTWAAKQIIGADALISVAHVKGHDITGFAASLKNIGVGCASKRGKFLVHSAEFMKPKVDYTKCLGKNCPWADVCEQCCPEDAIQIGEKTLKLDFDKCVYCWACINVCSFPGAGRAISTPPNEVDFSDIRIAETTHAIVNTFKNGKVGFMNYLVDITPKCDCIAFSDSPMIPNIGVLASFDPVAIDQASYDLMYGSEGIPKTKAEDLNALAPGRDLFKLTHKVDPLLQLKHGEKIGLGSRKYELVKVKFDRREFLPKDLPQIKMLKKFYSLHHPFREYMAELAKETGKAMPSYE